MTHMDHVYSSNIIHFYCVNSDSFTVWNRIHSFHSWWSGGQKTVARGGLSRDGVEIMGHFLGGFKPWMFRLTLTAVKHPSCTSVTRPFVWRGLRAIERKKKSAKWYESKEFALFYNFVLQYNLLLSQHWLLQLLMYVSDARNKAQLPLILLHKMLILHIIIIIANNNKLLNPQSIFLCIRQLYSQ